MPFTGYTLKTSSKQAAGNSLWVQKSKFSNLLQYYYLWLLHICANPCPHPQQSASCYFLQPPYSMPHRPLSSQVDWQVLEKELPLELHASFTCFTLSFYTHSFQKVSPFAHFLHLTHIRKQNVTIPAAGLRPNTNNLFLTFKYSSRKYGKQNWCRFCSSKQSLQWLKNWVQEWSFSFCRELVVSSLPMHIVGMLSSCPHMPFCFLNPSLPPPSPPL